MASEKPTSRREFLSGKAAARALLNRARGVADAATSALNSKRPPESLSRDPTAARLTATRRAMACEFAVEYHAADGVETTDAALAALNLIEQIEDQLTVYRDHSEVLTINATAAQRSIVVEPQLFALLELSAWLHNTTDGAFDITSGPLSKVWGFFRREGRIPEQEAIDEAMESVGGRHVVLDVNSESVRFDRPGVEINLNSIGKGYALDRAARLMDEQGAVDYLWHGGNSSVLARGGVRGHSRNGWTIGLPHPLRRDRPLGEIQLVDRALGTAGSATQFFEAKGRRFGHVIDPRSGWPAEGVLTATAIASTAAEADALATAFYVLGPGKVAEYCAAHDDVAAVIIAPSAQADNPEDALDVHVLNLGDDSWRRVAS